MEPDTLMHVLIGHPRTSRQNICRIETKSSLRKSVEIILEWKQVVPCVPVEMFPVHDLI